MNKLIWVILFLGLLLRIGIYHQTQLSYPNGTKIRISDRVTSEPVRYPESQYFRLQGLKIYLPLYPEVSYGDRLVVEGEVDGEKLKKAKLITLTSSRGQLFGFRKKIIAFYQSALPADHAALVAGVTIGSKSGISTEFWEKLKRSGTAHVVVASGMNVTLVGKFLVSFFIYFFSRKRAVLLALAGIWFYSIISGFDAPIVRAAIMGSVAFTAIEAGRLSNAWRALFLSAAVMLFLRPDWISDYGFLLSFAATASILAFEKKIKTRLKSVPSIIREDLSTTLAAQIGVVPIFLYGFGQFNLMAPIYNVMVLWTIVPMTMIGMFAGIMGVIFEPVGKLVLLLSYPLTSWFTIVISNFHVPINFQLYNLLINWRLETGICGLSR